MRRSARLPLLGWVSTALHPPPFFSSSRRHRLLLAFYCLLSRFILYRPTTDRRVDYALTGMAIVTTIREVWLIFVPHLAIH